MLHQPLFADLAICKGESRKGEALLKLDLGAAQIHVVSDGEMNLGPAVGQYLNASDEDVLENVRAGGRMDGQFVIAQNCFLVSRGERLVLIDTGVGPNPLFGPTTGKLLANLAAAGIDPARITDVILTHPHLDHAGGVITAEGIAAFPGAPIHVNAADFDFWTDPSSAPSDSPLAPIIRGVGDALLPLRERIVFYEPEEEIVPGFTAVSAPGHTLHHCAIAIDGDGAVGLVSGDAVHHQMQMAHPHWEFHGDADGALAARTRARLFDMASADNMVLLAFHFAYPGVGRIARRGNSYAFEPA